MVLTQQDGSFRRLIEMMRERQVEPPNRLGRPPKHRIPTTGHFEKHLHERMKRLAQSQSDQVDHAISTSDLYNEAAQQMLGDLRGLLGDDLRLPAGAMTLTAVLGLRELVDRPLLTPLRELEIDTGKHQRTTLYFDPPVWDALLEMSLRFGLRMRKAIHVHRLIELGLAWYLAGIEPAVGPALLFGDKTS